MLHFEQTDSGILGRTFRFSLHIIEYCNILENNKQHNMAYQLFKSGTSIGANVAEAQNAESKPYFIHKMKIASKEAGETAYWLQLCKQSPHYPECDDLLKEMKPIILIISKIILTSKSRI